MTDFPTTHIQLIAAIANAQQQREWGSFFELYQPAILNWLLKRGLKKDDAEDCAQQILISVARSVSKFERDSQPASFRRWLMRIARNEMVNHIRRQVRIVTSNSESRIWEQLDHLVDDESKLSSSLDLEYQRAIFHRAALLVRGSVQPKTWDAFWKTMVQGESTNRVAKDLAMSVGGVYVAKGRVLQKLQSIVDDLLKEDA